jgi:peptidoglycan/LPS O-acetylase OafA/YrhL
MNRGVSLYLDVARFAAALVVFLGHVSTTQRTGGFLDQIALYAHTAVIVFFVMSGYFIAFVLDGRENTARQYAIARLARLYSVVLPALVITAVCDGVILRFHSPVQYEIENTGSALSYIASLLFVNHFWFWQKPMFPGVNSPFWSLSFEVAYYVAAGLFAFTSGWPRIVLLAILCGLAGPIIVLLAPVWFLGYTIYHLKPRLSPAAGWWLSAAGLVLLLLGPKIREVTGGPVSIFAPEIPARHFLLDYYEALGFGLHLIGIHAIAQPIEFVLVRFSTLIRWLASFTFALYLFHYPLLAGLTALSVGESPSWAGGIFAVGVTLFLVATVGRWCEQQKTTLRRWLLAMAVPYRRQA